MFASSIGGITELKINPAGPSQAGGVFLCSGFVWPCAKPAETIGPDWAASPLEREFRAYLQGALHDGTRNHLHRTHRFAQKGTDWLLRLQKILTELECKS
jgi:hypothetical protein